MAVIGVLPFLPIINDHQNWILEVKNVTLCDSLPKNIPALELEIFPDIAWETAD